LAIPIDLRAAKALPKNCGRRPLVSRETLEKGRGGFFKFFIRFVLQQILKHVKQTARTHTNQMVKTKR
jgi:hypothetical protein